MNCFFCCDILYFFRTTLKTQVSNTMNSEHLCISWNDKYLLLLLWLLQTMFKVSFHQHAGLQTSTPLIHCHTDDVVNPSCATSLSVAPSSGWRHESLSGRQAFVGGPWSHSPLDWCSTFINIRSSLLITISFLFMQTLRKCWRQYWQGVSTVSNGQASCHEISHKHCK